MSIFTNLPSGFPRTPLAAVLLTASFTLSSLWAEELLSENFDLDDGGFTEESSGNTPIPSVYNEALGTWSMEGDESGPATNYLISPAIAVANTAGIQVTFTHRYSIETEWDGAAFQFSLDGGPFKTVPLSAFTQNGYTFGPLIGNHPLNGGDGFNGDSTGYFDGNFLTSVANLGGVPAGSELVIRFIGAWDEGARGTAVPGWEIDSVLVETLPDTDNDGMPDAYEDLNGLDKTVDDSGDDDDLDLVTNVDEFVNGTNPQEGDTDGDNLSDGVETNTGIFVSLDDRGTDPLVRDSDDDGLQDDVENGDGLFVDLSMTGTNPNLPDSDDDGYFDLVEATVGTDPNDARRKPPLPEPLGFWTFDDEGEMTTADLTSNEMAGQLLGPPAYVAGHSGSPTDFALDFDGIDDAVTTLLSLNGLASYTLSGWVKTSATSADRAGLFGQNDLVEFGYITGTTLELYTSPGGGVQATLAPVDWTHLAVVSDTEGRRIYVNGVEVIQGGTGTPLAESAFFFNIGGGGIYDGSGNYFTGQIDDVAVWGEPLGARIIEDLASGSIDPMPLSGGVFQIAEFKRTEENTLNFLIDGTIPGRDYIIESSPDLVSWLEITDFIGTNGATQTSVSYTPLDPNPKTFYRAQAIE